MQLTFSIPADGTPHVNISFVALVSDTVRSLSPVLTSIDSLSSVSFRNRERGFITNNNSLPLLLGPSDMMSRPGKAGGAVSWLKAIFVHWALARNALIFQTTSHLEATYHVSADPLS